jgi:hypothetical protein
MKNQSSYISNFKNGQVIISRGIKTNKFDWFLEINLDNDEDGNQQFIFLDRNIFITKKSAFSYAKQLLNKYKLI